MLSAIQIVGFLNQTFLQSHFFHVDTNSQKIKSWLKSFWQGMVKIECHQSGLETLKLIVSQERNDGTKWFFAYWYNFTQRKVDWTFLGWTWSKMGVASQVMHLENWLYLKIETDGINWFFACWYMITEIKSLSKMFWVSMVKYGCCQSGHWTQQWTGGVKSFFILEQIQES